MSESDRLEINWFNVVGGALAAVSAAVVLSTLGTAGTLIGAAVGSLCITIGGAVYSHSMKKAHEQLLAKRAMLARASAQRGGGMARTRALSVERAGGDEETSKESRLELLKALPWKRIIAVSAAVFAIAMAVIVVFEISTGRPVSSFTGGSDSSSGTSVPGIGGGDKSEPDPTEGPEGPAESPDQQDEQPDQDEEPVLPSEEPTPLEDSVEPSPSQAPTVSESAQP